MTGRTANAGWYQDPNDPSTQRWWDGNTWTTHVQPSPAPAPQPPAPVAQATAPPAPAAPFITTSPGVAPDGLEPERQRWLEFAKAEFWEMVQAYDAEHAGLEQRLAATQAQLIDTSERVDLQEVGLLFDGIHPTATSIQFKEAVDTARTRRKEMAKRKTAVLGSTGWTVNGSLPEGRKMVEEFSKLMLRAYNSELDSLVKTTNATNSASKTKALGNKRDQIKKLGKSMNIEIAPGYHDLAIYEIQTTGSFQVVKLKEKEADRAHREQLREQKKLEAEIKREQDKLNKEATLHRQALDTLQANPDADPEAIELLRAQIVEVEAAQADVYKREANTRAGHVYVISNPGAFGDGVVKIGMTRRLNPMDRVIELGDASVPFRFSVHALIFSDDAVGLETELHHRFESARINRVNLRREFFRTTPVAVRDALADMNAHLIEFDENPVNQEWEASR